MDNDKKCETCQHYYHSANILGVVAECKIGEKYVMTFWPNAACDKYKESDVDKLKNQRQFFNENGTPNTLNK